MVSRLSILIVNWKSKDYVRHCLRSILRECTDLDPQIVVVDGGSFDGCDEMISREFPNVEFVQGTENIGFGRSNNLGFAKVTGDFVLLLNPDTELRAGAVQALLLELERHPDAGLIGPRLLNTDGSLQTSCVQALPTPWNQALDSEFLRRWLPNSSLWGVGDAFRSTAPTRVEAISGACMMMRSGVFRQLGGFSSQFFMYAEDMDLCARMRKAGLQVIHVPRAEVVHHGGGSSRTQVSHFSTVMMRVALETYMRLNHGTAAAIFYRALQGVSALVRVTLGLPASNLADEPHRSRSRQSVKKWWFVLKWAVGISTLTSAHR